jgi:Fur family peroxide stress response transcriptional regulator
MDSLQEQLTAFEVACRKARLKVTHQRLEIYRELLMATDHPTADSLHQRLRMKLPTISLDTVYRTLATLANRGLINRVETAESLARFEATRIRHHHLICRNCGEIMDFGWALIDEVPLPDEITHWGKIEHKNVVVYGVCNRCLQQRTPPAHLVRNFPI